MCTYSQNKTMTINTQEQKSSQTSQNEIKKKKQGEFRWSSGRRKRDPVKFDESVLAVLN